MHNNINFNSPLLSAEEWSGENFNVSVFASDIADRIMPLDEQSDEYPVLYFANTMIYYCTSAAGYLLRSEYGDGGYEKFTLNNALSLSVADDAFFTIGFLKAKRQQWYQKVEKQRTAAPGQIPKRIGVEINDINCALVMLHNQYSIYDGSETEMQYSNILADFFIALNDKKIVLTSCGFESLTGPGSAYSFIKKILVEKDEKNGKKLINGKVISKEALLKLYEAFNDGSHGPSIIHPYRRIKILHDLAVSKIKSLGIECRSLYSDNADSEEIFIKKLIEMAISLELTKNENREIESLIEEAEECLAAAKESSAKQKERESVETGIDIDLEKIEKKINPMSPNSEPEDYRQNGVDALFYLFVTFLNGINIKQDIGLSYSILLKMLKYADAEHFRARHGYDLLALRETVGALLDLDGELPYPHLDEVLQKKIVENFTVWADDPAAANSFNWYAHAEQLKMAGIGMTIGTMYLASLTE